MRYNELMESTQLSVRDLNLPPDFWESNEIDLSGKKLDSLNGCPVKVQGYFNCQYNQLTSLIGCPSTMGGGFYCTDNHLTSLADIHKHIRQMDGTLFIGGNPIISHLLGILLIRGCMNVSYGFSFIELPKPLKQAVDILNKYVNKGRAGIMDCQAEMLAAGLDEFAQI